MTAETTHRGVEWRREADGSLFFHDSDRSQWVKWAPGVDAPPLPPEWGSKRVSRAGWRTRWRLIPIVITVVAVIIAVIQVLKPSGNQTAKETRAAEAMLGKCLHQHSGYLSPVSCSSPDASFKVVQVLPTTPGSPTCRQGTTPVVLVVYTGVRYPHEECMQPIHP